MDRNEKLKILQALDEKTLTERFLIPLHIEGMKYKKIQYNPGTLECGKDFIYCTTDRYGSIKHTGVHVKAIGITARNKHAMLSQIIAALSDPFTDLNDGQRKCLDEIVLITSCEITEGAKKMYLLIAGTVILAENSNTPYAFASGLSSQRYTNVSWNLMFSLHSHIHLFQMFLEGFLAQEPRLTE